MGVHVLPILNPLPPPSHPIPQGHPSALALSALSHASNLDWRSISHTVLYILISFKAHLIRSAPLRKLFPIWLTQIHYHWKCVTSGKFLLPHNTAFTDVMDHLIHKVLPTLKERGLYKSQIAGVGQNSWRLFQKVVYLQEWGPKEIGLIVSQRHCW